MNMLKFASQNGMQFCYISQELWSIALCVNASQRVAGPICNAGWSRLPREMGGSRTHVPVCDM